MTKKLAVFILIGSHLGSYGASHSMEQKNIMTIEEQEINYAIECSMKTYRLEQAARNIQAQISDFDSEWAAAIALSMETGKETKIQPIIVDMTNELYEQVGVIISNEFKKITDQFPEYTKADESIDNYEKIKQEYIDAGTLHIYNQELASLTHQRDASFERDIKPRLDALNIHQIIIDNIPGLSAEQAEEILERLGYQTV